MASNELKQRFASCQGQPQSATDQNWALTPAPRPHPAGKVKHGTSMQTLRMLLLVTWFVCCCTVIHVTQLVGAPLYFINRDYYYTYMALTKQSFGVVVITVTQWFSPTLIRVSGDDSVKGQLKLTPDGRLETDFPERLVLIANHQLYSEWLYFWWIAYTSRMHGHIFIVLKQSLKYIPVMGPGMMFFGFIFMARSWVTDKLRMQHRLKKLTTRHSGPLSGSQSLDPMWLLIFPEGTNLSGNTRKTSAKWAAKQGIADLKHQLLPRSTGLQYCLAELKGSVEWVYDCTIAYEGIPKDGYGQDYFTLRSTCLEGRPPKSVNMYWRRFAVSSIPVDDPNKFERWVNDQWLEKEALLEYFSLNGRFPTKTTGPSAGDGSKDETDGSTVIETEVKLSHFAEIGQIFVVLASLALVANILGKAWNIVVHGTMRL